MNPSERVRVEKLRRFSTFVILLKANPGGLIVEGSSRVCRRRLGEQVSSQKHLAKSEKSQGGGIDGQDSLREAVKSHQSSDLGGSCTGFKPSE
jgi:hypothetical protein